MRRVIASLAVSSFAAVPAFAQDADTAKDRIESAEEAQVESGQEDTPSEGESEGGAGFGGDQSGDAATPNEGGETPSTAPESYTVQPGDTLWTLSQRFLNNPWYWPKVWSYNPQLENPNWIRPGTVIRFYPGEAEPIVQVQPEPEPEDTFDDIGSGGQTTDDTSAVTRALDNMLNGGGARRREYFIPAEKLEDSGQILNSPEEKIFLSTADRTYVKLKKGDPGETLQVFRKERDVRHPVTGANLGALINMIGEMRVDTTGKEQSLGTVTSSWDVMQRGDYVASLPLGGEQVRRAENSKQLKGYVVDTGPGEQKLYGENYAVVVDKGSNDGVQVGNTFTVVRVGDPYTRQYSGMVDEDIGEIMIIETFKSTSAGIMLQASREVVPGDRVEMRTK